MSQINQYSFPTKEDRFWSRVDKSEGCWNWIGGKDKDGYGKILTNHKHNRAHRFSWEIHNGPVPRGLSVLHSCDNTSCVRPEHLFVGTAADNNRDRSLKLRTWSKLSPLQVRIIRRGIADGLTHKYLAGVFGIGMTAISNIRTGHKWKYL